MRIRVLITCFLLSSSIFAQESESITKEIKLPKSIFVANSLGFQPQKPTVIEDLHLTGHSFLIVDRFYSYGTNLYIDTRNIGRIISDEDLKDNYLKASLNLLDVNKNSNHFIWNMWDVSLQNQDRPPVINKND